jgi:hypothetical protein
MKIEEFKQKLSQLISDYTGTSGRLSRISLQEQIDSYGEASWELEARYVRFTVSSAERLGFESV